MTHFKLKSLKANPIQDILSSIGISFPGNNLMQKYANEKPPLRAELFSADQMEQQGKGLAAKHKLLTGKTSNYLLKRLSDNEEQLLEIHELLTEAVKTNQRIIPAGEWLLDNFYLILEQIQTGKKHLPKSYSEDLPLLANGPSSGLPRVYDIATEIISHSDGRLDLKNLDSFISAYQLISPLNLGELWAIPIMLRLALIENLRRLATQIAYARINQNLADYWAEEMINTSEKNPKNLILVIADMARSNPPVESSFVAELTRMLQGRGPALALPLNWVEQRLSETGQTSSEVINAEIQKQSTDQVSMSNSIGSLRFLGKADWREFVESVSIVEQILNTDINGVYASMDFSTRDSYRHVVEKIAKYSDLTEPEVAQHAIRLANISSHKLPHDERRFHVGYYLVDKGLTQLEKGAHLSLPLADMVQQWVKKSPLLVYMGSIMLLTLAIAGAIVARVYGSNTPLWLTIIVAVLTIIGASHFATAIVNWLVTLFITPKQVPRMNFTKGVRQDCRTMVIIPTMLTGVEQLERLAESLEVYYLANKDEYLHFGLLTDFKDANTETEPGDAQLLDMALQKIKSLNAKYQSATNSIFYLFHRPRKWNIADKLWMGYERKRGKLTDLNAALRGEGMDRFSAIFGNTSFFSGIKYVITIDSDTQLPRDAARTIIASMAHPLNKAFFNEKKNRVTEGYGILQPRVALSLTGSAHSLFARLHGTDLGIDPYTRSVSDVYQDLFEEGSFIGKGIYDVDVFRKGLDNRFPDNRILSHDLLEGCILRSGFLSDVQMYEEHPAKYSVDVKRRHRWIRGDWQIAAWAFPLVPAMHKGLMRNQLSALSRWKIFDNLRRSLVPFALITLLVLGGTILKDGLFWTFIVTAILLLPSLIIAARDILHKPKEILLKQHFADSIQAILNNFYQTLFVLACLPFEASFTVDAILRSLWRMIISKKHLLEWNTSEERSVSRVESLRYVYRFMWSAPFMGLAGLVYLTIYAPLTQLLADPILIMWMVSPGVAWLLSRPLENGQIELTSVQINFLRKLARKTWAYFDHFVTANENWLPPDNYQEHPVERIAHRTSPTNIGLALMANLAAVDFGYITGATCIERTTNTFRTMQIMERYRGHFYNWYDTETLRPLPPLYVSTVDSGNLAGQLLTLRQGIIDLPNQPILGRQLFNGLRDTLELLKANTDGGSVASFKKQLDHLIAQVQPDFFTLYPLLTALTVEAERMSVIAKADLDAEPAWADELFAQCKDIIRELSLFPLLLHTGNKPEKFSAILPISTNPTLGELAGLDLVVDEFLRDIDLSSITTDEATWLDEFRSKVESCSTLSKKRMASILELGTICNDLAEMEYDFLYDKNQHLLTIGYNADDQRRDPSYYDLLASEARLSTFVAISQGKIPQESWFALGRQLTNAGGDSVLLSWSGSMFEYLMPLLYMPTYENTLLHQTYKVMVERQIEYGRQLNVPWGISESGYNLVDASLNLQYRAFGVPELGLKRGLSEDVVIAPYATMMALMVNPEEAYRNLQELSDKEFEGRFGYYEAIDYTPSRVPRGQSNVVIRSFMAHHEGMSLLSLLYLLEDKPMQKRFENEPQFQATLLLLQERIPKATKFFSPPPDVADISVDAGETEMRILRSADTPVPEVQLLSNGNYHVMVTNAGGGYSRWKNLAVTRWREDATCDNWGNFCFIRDLEKENFWSAAHQPTIRPARSYETVFSQGRAEFRRFDNDIDTHTEITVSPEDDIEIRRVRITNRSRRRRSIELTSYAEIVLASPASDNLHPAFSNLFVQTEINVAKNAIICTRRPRSAEEHPPWMFHLMKTNSAEIQQVSYETDRMQFIGRGNTISNPKAMNQYDGLSGSEGAVLDPVASIQYRLSINPMETVIVDIMYGIGNTREVCDALIDKYQDPSFTDRAFELSWTHSQMILRQINATEADAQLFSKLAGSVIYPNASLRAEPSVIMKNNKGQSGLWSYSISGDIPIVLLQIADLENIGIVKQLVQAHAYWRMKGLIVDLVIWNDDYGGYRQVLQNQLLGMITAGQEYESTERPGGIFVRITEHIPQEDRILIQSVARLVLTDSKGSLISQVNKRPILKSPIPHLIPKDQPFSYPISSTPLVPSLVFDNSMGGFSTTGNEYIIYAEKQNTTPLPWVNVIANPRFGSVISEAGQMYTWVDNAHEFRLTPWNNDPVSDSAGEAYYIRDEETGMYWSPSSLPCRGKTSYVTSHGFGYSRFEHIEQGIVSNMTIYVDVEAPVKFIVIRLQNRSTRSRRLSITGYVEWVLGDLRSKSSMHVVTEVDPSTGAIFARNSYNKEFNDRVCFFDINESGASVTGDRTEFIGRNGSLYNPDAMGRVKLSGKTGAGMDPCAAIQCAIDLEPDQEHEVIFLLGTGEHTLDATNILRRFSNPDAAVDALEKVKAYWQQTLGNVQVDTPDGALNMMANGWLMYQTLACRFFARSGFYQSGGAFGFRDQLQDALAVIHTDPQLVRKHILLCASRQFKEGDVQHWWHPPMGRGVRTKCSDDFLWLPLATARYVEFTGDISILREHVSFLEGRLLGHDEESYYDLPGIAEQGGSLYEHCTRAINNAMRFGRNGLPLMGSGDWNDGMDRVGIKGEGESVWLAFFLYETLLKFSDVAQKCNEPVAARKYQDDAAALKERINRSSWDGAWYRRAYFDDGTALGTAGNQECRIDSIAQSWSVLSGAGEKELAISAMDAAYQYLVRKDKGIIQLLDPPFDKGDLNPGYIKGYVPGVRENGGQYTHAAIWLVMAFAALKDRERTWELFTMINPVNHGNSRDAMDIYKAEPYVVAADVYSLKNHVGRAGWTWYTGSAGWMYRLILESIIGLKKVGNLLYIDPCIPGQWPGFTVQYRFKGTMYQIRVTNSGTYIGSNRIILDGIAQNIQAITLVDDRVTHNVDVLLPVLQPEIAGAGMAQ